MTVLQALGGIEQDASTGDEGVARGGTNGEEAARFVSDEGAAACKHLASHVADAARNPTCRALPSAGTSMGSVLAATFCERGHSTHSASYRGCIGSGGLACSQAVVASMAIRLKVFDGLLAQVASPFGRHVVDILSR